MELYLLEINPEPWTASEGSIGRRNGKLHIDFYKNEQLRSYQQAVRETLLEQYPQAHRYTDELSLKFFLWRQLPSYEGETKKVRKHQADATNLQKALEDALQGVLFDNDRNVREVSTSIMAQGPSVEPRILIKICAFRGPSVWASQECARLLAVSLDNRSRAALARSRPRAESQDDDLF